MLACWNVDIAVVLDVIIVDGVDGIKEVKDTAIDLRRDNRAASVEE